MGSNILLGKLGEDLASDFLKKNGCKIIDKNFYTRYGEIDLIAKRGDEIFFIEVKTRTSIKYGYPETAVNRKKINHLLKAVHIYINIKKIKSFWRIDIISVELNNKTRRAKINWFKNISIDF